MKTIRFLTIISVFTATVGCDREPDPSPFLTVDVGFVEVDPTHELWIFANDENGRLIDIRRLQKGTNYLQSVRSDIAAVDLTVVRVHEGSHSFITYKTVKIDRPIKINTFNPVFAPANQVDLVVSNYNEGNDPYTALTFDGGFGYTGYSDSHTFTNGELKTPVAVYVDPGKLLISGYRSGEPVYSLTSGIKTRLVVKVDFTNFLPLENKVVIQDASSAQIYGHNHNEFNLGNFIIQQAPPSTLANPAVTIGYVPGFDYYTTAINKTDTPDEPWTQYRKVGARISNLTWPNAIIAVTDRSQENFRVECSVPIDLISTYSLFITNGMSHNWTVYGSDASAGIPDVPPMFLARLNASNKEVFSFFNGDITSSSGTYTHQDFLEEKLYDGAPKKEYEYFKFYFGLN